MLVRLASLCISRTCLRPCLSNCTLVFSLLQTTMETHECGGSAPSRGDQGTGTQASPFGRRSRIVDGDREFRVADHPLIPGSGMVLCKTSTGKMNSEQQAVAPLTSAAMRGMPHHAAEVDSGNQGSPLPVLHSGLPVLDADLPGLRTDLPGARVPLSGEHMPPPRGHAGELPRGRDGRRSDIMLSGHNARVQQDAVAPQSITATHRTAPAFHRARFTLARHPLVSARPTLVSAPWMPVLPRSLFLSPVLLCQRGRKRSTSFKTGGGWILSFPGIKQEFSTILSRPTPLQQPTGPFLVLPRALRVAIPWSLGLLDSDTLKLRRQLARLKSTIHHLDYEGLRMDRISKAAPVQDVCWTLLAPHPTTTTRHNTAQDHSSFGLARGAQRPLRGSPCWMWILSGSDGGVSERDYRARLFLMPGGPSRSAARRKHFFTAGCKGFAG